MKFSRIFFFVLLVCCAAPELRAQLEVDLNIKRRLFVVYEPIVATVTITNLTGRDILLHDADGQNWFSFQITRGDRLIPPLDVHYKLEPMKLQAGQIIKRSVNLNTLFSLAEFGPYKIRASIYFADMRRYFSAPARTIDVTEGTSIWQQTVGVPDGFPGAGEYRLYHVLSFQQPKETVLYVRVSDPDLTTIYATYPIGRTLSGGKPEMRLDLANRLHVLHIVGPKAFLHTQIGASGEWIGQSIYHQIGARRPRLTALADGSVSVSGGQLDVPVVQPAGAPEKPKLSDRPPGMPSE